MKTLLPCFKKATSLLILMLLMAFAQKSFGQSDIVTWTPTTSGGDGASISPSSGSNITANTLSSGNGSLGSGITGAYFNSTYGINGKGWTNNNSAPAATSNTYIQFQINPNTGYSLSLTQFKFTFATNDVANRDNVVVYWSNSSSFSTSNTLGSQTAIANGNTITFSSLSGITAASGQALYIRVVFYHSSSSSSSTLGIPSCVANVTATQTTISNPTISGSSFCVTSSSGSADINVAFTTTGLFISGNTFTAQLLNSSGTVINTNIGSASSSPITANIPANTASANYKINIVSSTPATTSAASSAITVTKYSNSIAPTASQSYAAGGSGNQLTVTESTAASSRIWYYATQSGGPYTSLAASATTYTPSNINSNIAGTYYIACISTFGTCGIKDTSNEVQVTVTPGTLANITTSPTTLATQKVGAYFPSIAITGKDAYGNVVTGTVGITISYSIGAFISPTTATLTNGTAALANIEVTQPGASVALTFASSATPAIKATISGFAVSAFASNSTDNFKTNNGVAASPGEWGTAGNWMSTHDAGNSWYTATSSPTNAAGSIAILSGYTVTVTSSSVTGEAISISSGGELDINSGGTLTIKDGSANALTNGGVVKVNSGGTLVNQGTFNNSGSVSVNSGGTYNHATNSGTIPTAAWDVASTCIVSGVTSTAPSGLGQAFGNFIWNSSQSSDINLNSALTTVNGIFTYSSSGASSNLILAHNNSLTLAVGNNFVFNNSGTLILTDGSSNPIINIAGSFNLSAGGSLDFADGGGAGTINVKGDFSATGASDINESNSGNNFGFAPNGTINFTGTSQKLTGSITGDGSNVDYNIKSGSTVTLQSNFVINNNNGALGNFSTFTIANGGTLICGTSIVSGIATQSAFGSPYRNSTFNLQSGGNLQIGSSAGIVSAGTNSGNVQTAVRTFNAGGNYTYNGTTTQSTGSGLPTSITGNLIVNNNGGTTGVTLYQATGLSGVLYLTNGLLTTTSTNLLSLSSTASTNLAVSDYTNTSYMNGPIQKTGTTAFTFPVGKSGTGYVPISISFTSASQTFRAEYIHSSASALGPIATGSSLQRVSSCDYWNLNLYNSSGTQISSLPSGVGVTLYWNQNNSCNVIHDLSSLAIGHFGTNWDVIGVGAPTTSGTTTSGSITFAGATNFSPFALATTNGTNNPLPITLDYFTATKQSGYNKLTWKVECTSSSSSFDVERSYDGSNFEAINTVKVSAVSDCSLPFVYDDYSSNGGKVYYRIKMVDVDDNAKYSNIELISNNANAIELMSIQPNPVYGDANLKVSASASQNIELAIIGIDGKQMQHKAIQVQQGTNTIQLSAGALAKGIYFVKGIFANGQTNIIKFVKQ